MTRRQNVDLASAAREYVAQRSAAKVSKATLLKERRALAALASANGSIWVRQVGELQIARALSEYGGRRRDLLVVLEDFLNWSRHMGYMPRGTDPLKTHRDGATRTRDDYFAKVYGRCMRCGRIGLVKWSQWVAPRRPQTASTRLCDECEGSLSLTNLGV